MTPTANLLAEVRLLRAMGNVGRAAAARALKSARLGRRPENPLPQATGAAASTAGDPMKLLARDLDARIVERGGTSIYATKARGTMSDEASTRFEAWAVPAEPYNADLRVGPERRRVLAGQPLPPIPKPGRIVAGLTGKLGGYASDRDDER